MSFHESSNEPWRKTLRLINQCPVCGSEYKEESARIFANKSKARFVHLGCGNCKANFVAIIITLGTGTSTVGMITDLSFEDAKRLCGQPAITIDDVIEGHKNINKKNFINQFQYEFQVNRKRKNRKGRESAQ